MAAVLSDHLPMKAIKTVSGNAPQALAKFEKAGQTFFSGVPVMMTTSGNNAVIQEWNATWTEPATPTGGIAGITSQFGSNYASDGAGAPGLSAAFTGVGAPGASPTFGKVPFQPSAVNFTPGTPMADGRNLFEIANEDSIFLGQFDSADGVAANATTKFSDEGTHFGLTKDATGHWYIDRQKVTQGTNTVVIVLKLDPNTGPLLNGLVWFKFEVGIQQLGN